MSTQDPSLLRFWQPRFWPTWLGLALPDIEGRAHKVLDASRQRFAACA